ncbi:2-C-methyl-D-erythritol 4-phosphate cytidylyltransferase [Jiangella asiatica]|uniref:2-C-methyl-D-erythritol 4-phosphate cytidylyltransferase n=1 Tax=Jiangella asiatica TaxID=2530372 RepID=A0A4R5DA30_9ACTN|nr:2-C-methyl-D-erythritol 4-phosphate cytidylyltransferase [Jiangella asiatica]TDE10429.1 2-C-methyl-D-erythritol 4-phosphate cytidylyltransferase [Jiangella asiatica]
MTVACILVAAGRGERLGGDRPKAFAELAGRPLVEYALRALARSRAHDVVAVVPAGLENDPALDGATRVVAGGATRQESVLLGLRALPGSVDVVLVHDAARCLAPPELFDAVVDAVAARHDAVVPGLAVVDTVKQVDDGGRVIATPDREALRAVQTPQGFRRSVLERAHAAAGPASAGSADPPASDDAGLVERLGLPVYVVPGHPDAFKITQPMDLLLAEAVLAAKAAL